MFGFLTEQLRELLVILHYDKEFVRYTDGGRRLCFADGTEAEADVLVARTPACAPSSCRTSSGWTPASWRSRASSRWPGPNMIMPRRNCGMFTAPHQSPGVDDETASLDPELFGNTEGYLMWSFAAKRPYFGREMSQLDGAGVKAVVCELIRDWHPGTGPDRRGLTGRCDYASVDHLQLRTGRAVGAGPGHPPRRRRRSPGLPRRDEVLAAVPPLKRRAFAEQGVD